MDFFKFKTAVADQFKAMSLYELFFTEVDKDEIWATYLASFPEGTNPVYRKRTEHDCSCCRQFMRAVGNVVAVIDGKLTSIWDIAISDAAYQSVANKMAAFVKSKPIGNQFLHPERTAGTDKNYEDVDGKVQTWRHFSVVIPSNRNSGRNYFCEKVNIGPKQSESRATHDVMFRGLEEITIEAIDTSLELISQNSLYRGEEHKFAVSEFLKLKKEFDKLPEVDRDNFVWSSSSVPASVSRFRNTAIGTLLVDISTGVDLDHAVGSFESKVAPSNYKRSTALVTKSMVEAAKQKIDELSLTSALDRRYAHLSDITINNILFADREAKKTMKGDVFDSIVTKDSATQKYDKVEEISIDKFISDIVPRAESIEAFVENKHVGNLVSLIAPVDAAARNLFKWDNNFSWSYKGDVTDSIKERVKQAGGSVTGDVCCRLAWFNYDDLDFHMTEPGGYEIFFSNRGRLSTSGGMLDVDMNAGHGTTREPVENIFYSKTSTMKEGIYRLKVHNFAHREFDNIGFEVELDILGDVRTFVYSKPVKNNETISVVEFKYSKSNGFEIIHSLPSTQPSRTIWGLKTREFNRVNVLMMSPNYWNDKGVGNRHFFFMLADCVNEEQARGFYNEFLREELMPHRKVIEIVGSKMKTEESSNQLSGLGFSSTMRSDLLVRVKGSFTRTVKVLF